MKPPPFEYAAPGKSFRGDRAPVRRSRGEVLAAVRASCLLNFRLATPQLVDLRRVPGLDRITREDGRVRLGAMVRQRQAEESAVVAEASPLLAEASATWPTRRSGRAGRSAAASPTPTRRPSSRPCSSRWRAGFVPWDLRHAVDRAADLYDTFFTTSLAHDEVLAEVDLPAAPPGSGTACVEITGRAGDYAVCGAVAQVTPEDDGSVGEARIALFGVGRKPQRAFAPEELLRGEHASRERVEEAASAASEGVSPADDSRDRPPPTSPRPSCRSARARARARALSMSLHFLRVIVNGVSTRRPCRLA